jgi:hypothetical protein
MRPTCTYCARKHLAQALILMQEAVQGYPEHRWLAIGHLAEAADELLKIYPEMAHKIRRERKRYESNWTDTGHVTVMELIVEVGKLDAQLSWAPSYTAEDLAIQGTEHAEMQNTERAAMAKGLKKRAAEGLGMTPQAYDSFISEAEQNRLSDPATDVVGRTSPRTSGMKPVTVTPPYPTFEHLNNHRNEELAGSTAPFRYDGWYVTVSGPTIIFMVEKTIEGRYWKIVVGPTLDKATSETRRTGDGFAVEPWSKERIEGEFPNGHDLVEHLPTKKYQTTQEFYNKGISSAPDVPAIPMPENMEEMNRPWWNTLSLEQQRLFAEKLNKIATYAPKELPPRNDGIAALPAAPTGEVAAKAAHASAREQAVHTFLGAVMDLPAAPTGDCPPCIQAYDDQVYALLTNALNDGKTYTKTVVILTTLSNFHPSYSLVSVVLEQAHALALGGRRVLLVVHRACDVKDLPPLPPEIILLPLLPVVPWHPDRIDDAQGVQFNYTLRRLIDSLATEMAPNQKWTVADIITHDVMFQSAYVTLAKAIHDLNTPERTYAPYVKWFHMAHSSVGERPTLTIHQTSSVTGTSVSPVWYRCTLPPGHSLLVLNYSDRTHFAAYYRWGYSTKALDVVEIPQDHIHTLLNPRDIRPFLRMTPTAAYLTSRYGLHLADVTVMFPVSMTRLRDKRVDLIIQMLGALKRTGLTVRLLIPTAHANGDGFVTGVAYVKEHALKEGLIMAPDDTPIQKPLSGVAALDLARVQAAPPYSVVEVSKEGHEALSGPSTTEPEVILTCSVLPDTRAYGLDADTIRSLWGVTNVFMLPSISEAGSLILLEAALAGCVMVLNQSLPALHDYIPLDKAIWVPWGSIKGPGQELKPEHIAQYATGIWSQVAGKLRRRIMQNHCLEAYAVALGEILDGPEEYITPGVPPTYTDTAPVNADKE